MNQVAHTSLLAYRVERAFQELKWIKWAYENAPKKFQTPAVQEARIVAYLAKQVQYLELTERWINQQGCINALLSWQVPFEIIDDKIYI